MMTMAMMMVTMTMMSMTRLPVSLTGRDLVTITAPTASALSRVGISKGGTLMLNPTPPLKGSSCTLFTFIIGAITVCV